MMTKTTEELLGHALRSVIAMHGAIIGAGGVGRIELPKSEMNQIIPVVLLASGYALNGEIDADLFENASRAFSGKPDEQEEAIDLLKEQIKDKAFEMAAVFRGVADVHDDTEEEEDEIELLREIGYAVAGHDHGDAVAALLTILAHLIIDSHKGGSDVPGTLEAALETAESCAGLLKERMPLMWDDYNEEGPDFFRTSEMKH